MPKEITLPILMERLTELQTQVQTIQAKRIELAAQVLEAAAHAEEVQRWIAYLNE